MTDNPPYDKEDTCEKRCREYKHGVCEKREDGVFICWSYDDCMDRCNRWPRVGSTS